MVVESTTYARVRDDETQGWLLMLDYHVAIQGTKALQRGDWDYLPHVADGGGSANFMEYLRRHPFPRFIVPKGEQ